MPVRHTAIGMSSLCSVAFIQRFGSALNFAPHLHTLVLDGVYPGPPHCPGDFVALPAAAAGGLGILGLARRRRTTACRASGVPGNCKAPVGTSNLN